MEFERSLNKLLPLLLLMLIVSCASMRKIKQNEVEVSIEEELQVLELRVVQARQQGVVNHLANELFVKAADASLNGNAKLSVRLYQLLLKLENKPFLERKYAIELIRAGELKTSLPYLSKVFKSKKEESIGLILGGVYVALGEVSEAQRVYRKILKNRPSSQEACVFLAKSYSASKEYKRAHQELSRCGRVANSGDFLYYRGRIELERGNNKAAEKYFKMSLKKNPRLYQSIVSLGLIYEQKEEFKKAKKTYQKYVDKYKTSNYAVLSKLVQVMLALGETKKVIPYIESLSELDQSDLNVKVKLGILYTDTEKYDEAKGVFEEILYVQPNSDKILYYLGSLEQQLGRSEEAIGYFMRINEESNLYADGVIQVAQLLSGLAVEDYLNSDKKNVERFLKFVRSDVAKDDEAKIELAIVEAGYYEAIERVGDAIAVVKKISHLGDFNEDHSYYLVSLLDRVNRSDEAMKIMRAVVAKNPNNADALNYVGYTLLEQGINLDEAYALIMKAVKLKPDDAYVRDSLGWYYYKTGDLRRALKEIKRAWELTGTDAVITKHLGLIYKELKKYSNAKKFYNKALKQCTQEEERQDILQELRELEQIRRLPASGQ